MESVGKAGMRRGGSKRASVERRAKRVEYSGDELGGARCIAFSL